jgi:hypothetical protein
MGKKMGIGCGGEKMALRIKRFIIKMRQNMVSGQLGMIQ